MSLIDINAVDTIRYDLSISIRTIYIYIETSLINTSLSYISCRCDSSSKAEIICSVFTVTNSNKSSQQHVEVWGWFVVLLLDEWWRWWRHWWWSWWWWCIVQRYTHWVIANQFSCRRLTRSFNVPHTRHPLRRLDATALSVGYRCDKILLMPRFHHLHVARIKLYPLVSGYKLFVRNTCYMYLV